MNLSGKVALVTGAGTGIGKGVAIGLAQHGAKVAIHYNRSDAGAKDTLEQIQAFGGDAILVQANVQNNDEITRMVKQVADHYGRIDVLVNNAALQLNYSFFEYDESTFDRMMSINLKGYWQCIQAVVPYMKKQQSGRIMLMSSIHGKRPGDFDVAYSMTKGGIRMLGREAAIELAKYGITVNTLEPGSVHVGEKSAPDSKPFLSETEIKRGKPGDFLKKFPMGRVGKPADVAALACFLASDESEFITGASIRLDGASVHL